MPRPRSRPLFELAGQWIATDPQSRFLHRFWTEPGTGRTRRASLGTEDLGQAKLKLAEIVLQGAPKTASSPLAIVLERYFEEHSDRLASRKVARGHGRKVLQFFGLTAKVEALSEARQKEFAQDLLAQGFKLAYAARIMVTVAAAFAHSRIAKPEILYTEAAMVKAWRLAQSPTEKAAIPTDHQCAQLALAKMPPMLARFLIINALTGGRPQTAVDLAPAQFIHEAGLVDLNPPKRSQNKKYRPKVRACRVLRFFLRKWEREGLGPYGERYCGYTTMEGVKTGLQRLAEASGVAISSYSGRHKVSTVLRLAGVPEDQIASFLGHRRQNLRTTAGYGEWDPSYQREAAAAVQAWFLRLRKMARRMAQQQAANSRHTPELAGAGQTRAA